MWLLLFFGALALVACGAVLTTMSAVTSAIKALYGKNKPEKVRTFFKGERLVPNEVRWVHMATCPDCGSHLLEGPSAALCVNYICTSIDCGSCFNFMGPHGVERLTDAKPFLNTEARHCAPDQGPYRSRPN